jgi:hypothetical protein
LNGLGEQQGCDDGRRRKRCSYNIVHSHLLSETAESTAKVPL